MKALGIIAYETVMRRGSSGHYPPIQSFLPSTIRTSGGTSRLLLTLDDCDNTKSSSDNTTQLDYREQTKRPRSNNQYNITSVMMNAGVPYPLCRFIIDLLGGEGSVDADGILFRNDNAFTSFTDVVDDLNQMKVNPARYLHPSLKDVWRSVFEQMHGRELELNKLLEVASRVCGFKSNDALMEALAMLRSSRRQQVAFVTGQAGAGKTSLVMEMKKVLENQVRRVYMMISFLIMHHA